MNLCKAVMPGCLAYSPCRNIEQCVAEEEEEEGTRRAHEDEATEGYARREMSWRLCGGTEGARVPPRTSSRLYVRSSGTGY
ncbi:hypothetical protein GWI33_005800 [Rhynchophorus ferrugineus]|uniref:Uncharacterized protein n=1 Tax=Rhynchophorus ferrugineus TaxID=354439 RepID=A0A834IFV9_RHYFE|nr:hypothetical protein GWI33_005800 [Rhynchophorus ferrugineus]